jgi:hypothetical protein
MSNNLIKKMNKQQRVWFMLEYKMEFYLGKIIGEDLFVKLFGYLHPVVPFNELTNKDFKFLLKKYE